MAGPLVEYPAPTGGADLPGRYAAVGVRRSIALSRSVRSSRRNGFRSSAVLTDRVLADAEFHSDRLIRQTFSTTQDHAAALRHGRRNMTATSLTFKKEPFFIAQNQHRNGTATATLGVDDERRCPHCAP